MDNIPEGSSPEPSEIAELGSYETEDDSDSATVAERDRGKEIKKPVANAKRSNNNFYKERFGTFLQESRLQFQLILCQKGFYPQDLLQRNAWAGEAYKASVLDYARRTGFKRMLFVHLIVLGLTLFSFYLVYW